MYCHLFRIYFYLDVKRIAMKTEKFRGARKIHATNESNLNADNIVGVSSGHYGTYSPSKSLSLNGDMYQRNSYSL